MNPENLALIALAVFAQIATGISVYTAIRADLAELKVRAGLAERRIERLEDQYHK